MHLGHRVDCRILTPEVLNDEAVARDPIYRKRAFDADIIEQESTLIYSSSVDYPSRRFGFAKISQYRTSNREISKTLWPVQRSIFR